MAVTIKPLEDRILVQPLEAEQTTASGLVIPDTAKEKPQEGRVIAAGPLGKIKTVTQMAAVLLLLLLSPVTGEAPLGERLSEALKSGSKSLLAETIKAVLAAGASRWFGG